MTQGRRLVARTASIEQGDEGKRQANTASHSEEQAGDTMCIVMDPGAVVSFPCSMYVRDALLHTIICLALCAVILPRNRRRSSPSPDTLFATTAVQEAWTF